MTCWRVAWNVPQEEFYWGDLSHKLPNLSPEIFTEKIRVTHERFGIDGSTEDPPKAKDPPDHDDQKPEEEDVVHVDSVHSAKMLQRKLWQENQEVKIAEDTA